MELTPDELALLRVAVNYMLSDGLIDVFFHASQDARDNIRKEYEELYKKIRG